jgi:hypothetical protein
MKKVPIDDPAFQHFDDLVGFSILIMHDQTRFQASFKFFSIQLNIPAIGENPQVQEQVG